VSERSERTPDSGAGTPDPGPAVRPDAHELLLGLAGWLDDDLLAWARELVAVGEEGQAVELVSAALAAERVALPPAVRTAVVAASRAAYTDLDADAELAPAAVGDVTGHRFDASARSGERVAGVLAGLPARRLAGCTLYLTWRLTPAGAAPGPVPRAVVLVETGPDRSADVLTYLLTTELDRAGVPASVEVFTAGSDLPAYHDAALRSAKPVEVGASVIAPAGVVVARTAAEAAARAVPAGPVATGPVVPAPVVPGPVAAGPVVPGPVDTAALFVVSSDDRGPVPGEPRRAGRRRRREPAPGSVAPGAGVDDAPDTDPFQGPLRVPLLAPLLDPTAPDDDRPAVPTPIRPVPAIAEPSDPADAAEGAPAPEVNQPARPVDETRPVAAAEPTVPDVPDDVPQEWEDDWRSGDWAMPPSGPSTGLPQPSESFDVFETQAWPAGGNAVEQTGRTAATHPDPARPRTTVDGPEPEPVPATGVGPELPSRVPEGGGSEEVRASTAVLGTESADAGPEGTAALQSQDRRGPVQRSAPAADASLFDSPTARVGPPPRPIGSPPDLPPRPDVSLFGEPSRDGHRPDGPPPDPARPGRRRRPETDDPEPGPDPAEEPSVLGSTERDLLASLQAELADRERRPRPYRRARSAAVNGHGVNGHGVNGHGSDGPAPNAPGADPGNA
jgi:hypothetical protein